MPIKKFLYVKSWEKANNKNVKLWSYAPNQKFGSIVNILNYNKIKSLRPSFLDFLKFYIL